MLPLTADSRRSTGPESSNQSRRSSRCRKIVSISTRARCAAHAEVLAEAERQMRVRAAIDAKRERVVEYVFVAVGRREVERDLVTGADLHAADFAVFGGDPREVADRCDPAQDLLDRVREQIGLGAELLPLLGVLAEREQPAADRVARRLVAGLDEQLAVPDELLSVSGSASMRPADQLADRDRR